MQKMCCCCFLLIRSKDDLLIDGSYRKKLLHLAEHGLLNSGFDRFLQNIQDCHYNALRHANNALYSEDELQRCTEMFVPGDSLFDVQEELSDPIKPVFDIDEFIEIINGDTSKNDSQSLLSKVQFTVIKDKGQKECGYKMLSSTSTLTDAILDREDAVEGVRDSSPTRNQSSSLSYTKEDVVRLLLRKTRSRIQNFAHLRKSNVKILEANGSSQSIQSWGMATELDKRQRRAFEILTATFVLTIQEDARGDEFSFTAQTVENWTKLDHERLQLERLASKDKRENGQLICLIHGPGGCGKSTVIDLVIEYAREFCGYIPNLVFDSRTIVVTAMTGVAATLINGETAHSAMFFNSRELQPSMIDAWSRTKMVIVDEISFANKILIAKMNHRLANLKDNQCTPFGGLHVVFCW